MRVLGLRVDVLFKNVDVLFKIEASQPLAIEMLIKAGADRNIMDDAGKLPHERAISFDAMFALASAGCRFQRNRPRDGLESISQLFGGVSLRAGISHGCLGASSKLGQGCWRHSLDGRSTKHQASLSRLGKSAHGR